MVQMSAEALRNNLTNPARTYLWEVVIPAIVGGGDADILRLRCQSTSHPGRSVGQIVVPYKQTAGVAYHGKLGYSHTWECTFIEGEDRKVFDALYSWKQRIVNDLTGVGLGDVLIKKDIYLTLVTTAGEENRRIRLVGCFPMEVPEVPLSYDDEGNIMFSVTFSYDRWEKFV